MVAKRKRGAGFRRRKSDSRNSETQECVLRTVYVRRGVDGEGVIKFHTARNLRRRGRAWVAPYTRESCETHEMVTSRSRRFGATVNRPNQTISTQTKGKLR